MGGTEHGGGGTGAGEWLYQRDGKLFGPLPEAVLVERLEAGQLSADLPVAREGGDFRPLREVPEFLPVLARIEARRKVEGEVAAARQAARRRGLGRVLLWGGAAAAVAAGVAAAVIVAGKARIPEPVGAEVRVSAPLIAAAPADPPAEGDDLLAYVEEGSQGTPRSGRAPSPRRDRRPGTAGAPSALRADPDGLATETRYDEAALNRVIAANQARLVACVREQAAQDPAFRGEVPLSFTVDNDGRVGKLWVDKPGYHEGGLEKCLKARLAEWRFPAFAGERPTISLSFRVGP
jgi:hypothetical protein